MEFKNLSFTLLILLSLVIYTHGYHPDCIYNIYVQTGSIPQAGTRSNISIFLSDDANVELPIVNLIDWGLMNSDHTYFNYGEVDLFAGKGPCLHGPACRLIIIVNGFDSWYCDSIQVSVVGLEKSCSRKFFSVKKWLDLNKGSAVILQDECPSTDPDARYGAART